MRKQLWVHRDRRTNWQTLTGRWRHRTDVENPVWRDHNKLGREKKNYDYEYVESLFSSKSLPNELTAQTWWEQQWRDHHRTDHQNSCCNSWQLTWSTFNFAEWRRFEWIFLNSQRLTKCTTKVAHFAEYTKEPHWLDWLIIINILFRILHKCFLCSDPSWKTP